MAGGKKRPRQRCKKCGEPSIPGLHLGCRLCQYHWCELQWGKDWADKWRNLIKTILPDLREMQLKLANPCNNCSDYLDCSCDRYGLHLTCKALKEYKEWRWKALIEKTK